MSIFTWISGLFSKLERLIKELQPKTAQALSMSTALKAFLASPTADLIVSIKSKHSGYIDDPNQHFWLSIKPLSKCLFSRRNGIIGKRFLGYSVCLRLFNKDIL